ncbi:MAG: class I SAM-dependent methyltransferase [Gammaproteobacteria bacterium]
MNSTIEYYDKYSKAYFNKNDSKNMKELYRLFLTHLPERATILDAGCGTGRDSKAFTDLGYFVTAFDASRSMVELCQRHHSFPIYHTTFDKFYCDTTFDGIWACASLLHCDEATFSPSLENLARFLRSGGILFASFVAGNGGRQSKDGRYFLDMNDETIRQVLANGIPLTFVESWLDARVSTVVSGSHWYSTLLRKD